MVTHSHGKNDRHPTCVFTRWFRHKHTTCATTRLHSKTWHRQTHKCVYAVHANKRTVSPSDCKCTHVCVPLLLTRIFHFITSLVCDDRDKTVVTEMSEGGREKEKGVWNWTGNYVLQLRHAEEILKAILQCLGTGCRKGGCNGRRQFNQNPRLSQCAGGWRRREGERQDSYV